MTQHMPARVDEPWLKVIERKEAVAKMPRHQLEAHLTLQGWVPIESAIAALQRGRERVCLVGRQRSLGTRYTTQYDASASPEAPWVVMRHAHIVMLAQRIEEVEERQ
jgi:hypothetical protein